MITEEVKYALQIVAEIDLSVILHYKLVLPEVEKKYGSQRHGLAKVIGKMMRGRLLKIVDSEYLAMNSKFEKMPMYDMIEHIDGEVNIPEWYGHNWNLSIPISDALRYVTVMDMIETGAIFTRKPISERVENAQYEYLCHMLPKDDDWWSSSEALDDCEDKEEQEAHRVSLMERLMQRKQERDSRMAIAKELARLLVQRNKLGEAAGQTTSAV